MHTLQWQLSLTSALLFFLIEATHPRTKVVASDQVQSTCCVILWPFRLCSIVPCVSFFYPCINYFIYNLSLSLPFVLFNTICYMNKNMILLLLMLIMSHNYANNTPAVIMYVSKYTHKACHEMVQEVLLSVLLSRCLVPRFCEAIFLGLGFGLSWSFREAAIALARASSSALILRAERESTLILTILALS